MTKSNSVRHWAITLRVLTVVAGVILCLTLGLSILFADLPPELRQAAGMRPGAEVGWWHRAAVVGIGTIPLMALLYVLQNMHRLFGLYVRGETLSDACAAHILRIGAGVLAAVVLEVFTRPLQILIASLVNPPGQRVLSLSVEGADLGQILAGGLIITVGWTLREAAHIAEDHRSIV